VTKHRKLRHADLYEAQRANETVLLTDDTGVQGKPIELVAFQLAEILRSVQESAFETIHLISQAITLFHQSGVVVDLSDLKWLSRDRTSSGCIPINVAL
jgi:hypothetical protein